MISAEGLIDGTWELTILVTDLQVERTLRVKGDLHVGGLMLKLVEALGELLCVTLQNRWFHLALSVCFKKFLIQKYNFRLICLWS